MAFKLNKIYHTIDYIFDYPYHHQSHPVRIIKSILYYYDNFQFYKLCDRWNKDIKKNSKTADERNSFQNSSYMSDTLKKVSERLNLQNILSAGKYFYLKFTVLG